MLYELNFCSHIPLQRGQSTSLFPSFVLSGTHCLSCYQVFEVTTSFSLPHQRVSLEADGVDNDPEPQDVPSHGLSQTHVQSGQGAVHEPVHAVHAITRKKVFVFYSNQNYQIYNYVIVNR